MSKDEEVRWAKCPFCGELALMNYKGRPSQGKCSSLGCHKVFNFGG